MTNSRLPLRWVAPSILTVVLGLALGFLWPVSIAPTPPTINVKETIDAAVARTVTALSIAIAATATAQAAQQPAITPTPTGRVTMRPGVLLTYPAGVDVFVASQAVNDVASGNRADLDHLRITGQVFDVSDGDEAVLVKLDGGMVRVKLLTGNSAGKTVWVFKDFVGGLPR